MLVLQGGLAPDYVLDRMGVYEMEALVDNLWMRDKEGWEQTRMQSYITAQCQSTKEMKPQDIMTFPWEKNEEAEDSEENLKAMEEEMNRYIDKLNNR